MLFNSLAFWLFLPLVLLVYWAVPARWNTARNYFLLAASYFFYAYWDVRFLSLIVLSTLVDYFAARGGPGRKGALICSVIVNLCILGYFKYANFFLDSAYHALQSLGVSTSIPSLDIVLPVGISFYTFQSMSYTIDVYKGRLAPSKNLGTVALYVAFFPQLMAGPIERAKSLLPQFTRPRHWNATQFAQGFRRFLLGMVKKVVVSPALLGYSQMQLMNPQFMSTEEAWITSLFWFMHLLMDFSGYADMAVGIGRMLGIELSENFLRVFHSQDFVEFWKRWHITLGSWFRDYVYVPLIQLGVTRFIAGLAAFTLIGFWHGASWNFVLWGFGLGVFWILDKRLGLSRILGRLAPGKLGAWMNSIVFFAIFFLLGQLFATDNLADAWLLMKTMVGQESLHASGQTVLPSLSICFALFMGIAISWVEPRWSSSSALTRLRTYVLIPWGILLCIEGLWASEAFEYFQF
jgi:alginate O-acetyltransferase complex protein AlgI